MEIKPDVYIDFDGPGGNSMAILARCAAAARKAEWPEETLDAFFKEAQSGDRQNLIDLVFECFEVQRTYVEVMEVDRSDVR